MIKVAPFLPFYGQCANAIALYEKAFGAKVIELLRYSDANPKDRDKEGIAESDTDKNLVYHAQIKIGNQRIRMWDAAGDGSPKEPSMSILVTFETADAVKAAHEIMSEGATIVDPMCSTTYSSCCVSLIDKFGVHWWLMTEQTKK